MSFYVLKFMFPSLFFKEFVKSFKYDVCQFEKHHHVTYPSSNTKSVHSFDLFILIYGGLHQILVYLVLNGLSLLLMVVPVSH